MEERNDMFEPDAPRTDEPQPENEGWDAARERFSGEDVEQPQEAGRPDAPSEAVPSEAPQAEPSQPAPVDWEARYRTLEAETEAMRRRLAPQPQPEASEPVSPSRSEQPKQVALPEEMKAEANVFTERYPELADLLTEDSAAGRLLRKQLGEYGTEEAAAYAIPIGEARRAAQVSRRAAQDAGQRSVEVQARQYWGSVEQAHPDVVRAIRNGHGNRLVEELRSWAKHKPYEEGSALLAAIENNGDAQGTISLLTRWKQDMQNAQAGQPTQDQRRDIARSMAAVPSRGGQAPAPGQTRAEGDGWDAAKRRWG